MYQCSRCLMTFREDGPKYDKKESNTICAEPGCDMYFMHRLRSKGLPIHIHIAPGKAIPGHVEKVGAGDESEELRARWDSTMRRFLEERERAA